MMPAKMMPAINSRFLVTSLSLLALAAVGGCKKPKTDPNGAAAAVDAAALVDASAPVAAREATATPPSKSNCPAGMLEIEGGKFFMGSDAEDSLDLEKPSHKVTIGRYCIDKTEVTVAAFKACVDAGKCATTATTNKSDDLSAKEKAIFDPLCNLREPDAKKDHPVNCVDWTMADTYCQFAGARLPTEAEWEFAARGPDGRIYPWGDEAPSASLLNACGKECVDWGTKNKTEESAMYPDDDGYPNTAPVGSFPKGASRYGLLDVVGNVWEWVGDRHGKYGKDALVDPKGPTKGTERVIRGGGWNGAYTSWVRPTFRYHDVPTKRSYGIGFRCAASIVASEP
jgi:formylglycine-generating enzyme required for sulfatase activity